MIALLYAGTFAGCAVADPPVNFPDGIKWETPRALSGPLDSSLPPDAAVETVRFEGSVSGRAAAVWTRGDNPDSAQPGIAGHPMRHDPDFILRNSKLYEAPVGELIAMRVVGPKGAEAPHFLPDVGPHSGPRGGLLSNLSYSGDKWTLMLSLWLGQRRDPPTDGLATVSLAASGFAKPSLVVPNVLPSNSGDPAAWLFRDGQATHLFWLVDFHTKWDAPFDGRLHLRLDHAVLAPNGAAGKPETVYSFQFHRTSGHQNVRLLNLGQSRFDLTFQVERGGRDSSSTDILHVADLLSAVAKRASRIATVEYIATVSPIPLSGDRLQLVWMDELEEDSKTLPPKRTGRLHESHLVAGSWSKPRRLFESDAWDHESLACASFRSGEKDGVMAVWRGEKGRLTYTMSLAPSEWSLPQTADLVIGGRNWLANAGRGLFLLTKMGGNLYYCFLSPKP